MRRSVGFACTILLILAGVSIPTRVSADCQGGPVWPSLDRARGTTFVGVFEGATAYNAEGDETFHWTVERVYAGPLNPGPLDDWGIGKPSCHPTEYREGTRYLVSSRFPGGGDAFDTVAYELLDGGRVRIAPFPMQPRSTAPKVYRRVDTLREALRLLVPSGPRTTLPSSRRPPFEPTSEDQARDDLFVLSISTDTTEVVADEPIGITTTLRYVGDVKNNKATVSGGGDLVAFGIEQFDGPIDTGPAWRLSCGFHEFGPDEVRDIPFAKSGGFDADDPLADFWRAWFADPVLRLPAGRYVITAYLHHGGRGPVCAPAPWTTRTASVAIEVLPAAAAPLDPSAAAPTVEPGASVGIAALWGPFEPDELTVSYTCEPPVTFTATELATAPGPDEVLPPIDMGSLVDPDDAVGLTDWRIVADDGERVLAVAGRDDPAVATSIPLHYLLLARTDTGWRWEGSGDCAPQARFSETYANGGFWRLDERRPPPGPEARAIHVKVWGDRDCRTSVEIRGEPVVEMTDDAVLLTIPVADISSGDMCTPGPPERITVQLPEPLGERELYDIGVLPPRREVP